MIIAVISKINYTSKEYACHDIAKHFVVIGAKIGLLFPLLS